MSRLIGIIALFLLLPVLATAAELLRPDPALGPRQVIEIQLHALQQNDVPVPDTGIAQTWALAHPDNRELTGPLERFAIMLKGPNYRLLLGHQSAAIEEIVRADGIALFHVTLVAANGVTVRLQWRVAKVRSGRFQGAWMTVAVSPPLRAGKSI